MIAYSQLAVNMIFPREELQLLEIGRTKAIKTFLQVAGKGIERHQEAGTDKQHFTLL